MLEILGFKVKNPEFFFFLGFFSLCSLFMPAGFYPTTANSSASDATIMFWPCLQADGFALSKRIRVYNFSLLQHRYPQNIEDHLRVSFIPNIHAKINV